MPDVFLPRGTNCSSRVRFQGDRRPIHVFNMFKEMQLTTANHGLHGSMNYNQLLIFIAMFNAFNYSQLPGTDLYRVTGFRSPVSVFKSFKLQGLRPKNR